MPTIGVLNDDGEQIEQEVISRNAAVRTDDADFVPSVVQNLKYDHEGEMSQITTEAGETENRREADKRPKIVMEGVITEEELPSIRALRNGQEITLVSDVYRGEVVITRTSYNQSEGLLYYEENGQRSLAFEFQLQMQQPE